MDAIAKAAECDVARTQKFDGTELESLNPAESPDACHDLSYLLGALSVSSDKRQEAINSSVITAGISPAPKSCAPTCSSESEQRPNIINVHNSNTLSDDHSMVMSPKNDSSVKSCQNGAILVSSNNFDAPIDGHAMKTLLNLDSNISPVIPLQSRTRAIKSFQDGDYEIVQHSHIVSPKLTISKMQNVNDSNDEDTKTDEGLFEDSILEMLQSALKYKKIHTKKKAQRKKVKSSSKSPVVVPDSDCNLVPLEHNEIQTKRLYDVNNGDVQKHRFLQISSQSSDVHNDHLLKFYKTIEVENDIMSSCKTLEIAGLKECAQVRRKSPANTFTSPQLAAVDICTSNIENKSNAFTKSTKSATYMDNDSVFTPTDLYYTSNSTLQETSLAEFGNFSLQSSLLNNFSIASESPQFAEKSSAFDIRYDHNNHEHGCSSPVILENNVYKRDHKNVSIEGKLKIKGKEINATLDHLADDLTISVDTKSEHCIKGFDTSNCQDSNPCYETIQSIQSDNLCNGGLPYAVIASRQLIGLDKNAMIQSACAINQKTYDVSGQIGFAQYTSCKRNDKYNDKENFYRCEPAEKVPSSSSALYNQCTNSKAASASIKEHLSMPTNRPAYVKPLHLHNAKSTSSKYTEQTKCLTQREYSSCSEELSTLHSVGTSDTPWRALSSSCLEESTNSPVSLADRLRLRLKASSTMSILKRMTHSQN